VATADVERQDDAVTRLEFGDVAPDLLDYPHRFVSKDVPRVDERSHHLVEVQVGAADSGRRDPNDRVVRLLDDWVRNLFDPNVPLALPRKRFHGYPLLASSCRADTRDDVRRI
jgi:hypothetical protein